MAQADINDGYTDNYNNGYQDNMGGNNMNQGQNNQNYQNNNNNNNNNNSNNNNNNNKGDDNSELFETNWKDKVESFEDMNLKEELLRGIFGHGFEKPSAIQQRGIIPVIQS